MDFNSGEDSLIVIETDEDLYLDQYISQVLWENVSLFFHSLHLFNENISVLKRHCHFSALEKWWKMTVTDIKKTFLFRHRELTVTSDSPLPISFRTLSLCY